MALIWTLFFLGLGLCMVPLIVKDTNKNRLYLLILGVAACLLTISMSLRIIDSYKTNPVQLEKQENEIPDLAKNEK